jgi:hypothetical protein
VRVLLIRALKKRTDTVDRQGGGNAAAAASACLLAAFLPLRWVLLPRRTQPPTKQRSDQEEFQV